MNWLWVGAAALVVCGSIFIYCVAKRRWTKRGLLVGLVNLPVVALVSVAPIRGWADPEYAGFSVGLLQASQGPMVQSGCKRRDRDVLAEVDANALGVGDQTADEDDGES